MLPFGGYENDVNIFVGWANVVLRVGPHALYATAAGPGSPTINYPPGYAIVLASVAYLGRALGLASAEGHRGFVVLLKLPAALADLAGAVVAAAIVRPRYGDRAAAVAVAIALFAPWTWPISALWGQVDALATLPLLAALGLAAAGRFSWSWVVLAAGILVKPFPVLVAPLIVVLQFRSHPGPRALLSGPIAAIGLAYLVALPFASGASPAAVASFLLRQYAAGQSLFPVTSVNAYNLWTLVTGPQTDRVQVAGLSLQEWGWTAYLLFAAVITATFAQRLRAARSEPARELAVASFLVLAGMFVLMTRMHERYLIYALAIVPWLWFTGRTERVAAILFTVTFTLNVGLDLLSKHANFVLPFALVRSLSWANVAGLAFAAIRFVRPALPDGPTLRT